MKFKKITGIFTAFACAGVLASSIGMMTVSAATYHSCDINHDGSVDIIDAMTLQEYLDARIYIADTKIMDVDRNNIVDYADYHCVLATAVNVDYKNVVDGLSHTFKPSANVSFTKPTTAKNIQEDYVKYVYADAKNNDNYEPEEYSLSMTENLSNISATSSSSPNKAPRKVVVGTDDRVVSIQQGMIILRHSNNQNMGSAFIVDDHTIATAAHCVYDYNDENPADSEWVTNYKIYLYENNKKLTPIAAHAPKKFLRTGDATYDYALITVKEDLSSYYHFNLGVPYNVYQSNYFSNYWIHVTGFPSKVNNVTERYNNKLYTAKGKLYKPPYANYTNYIGYDTDTSSGESGCPAYIKENYQIGDTKYNINVVTNVDTWEDRKGFNYGAAFTPIILKFYLNNSYVKADYQ